MKHFFSISMCVMALLFASCEPIEPSLSGVFSVSDSTKVTFSPGNLQYTQSTDTWEFAINQYDMIGENNVKDGKLADKIDLFGWSSTGSAKFGVSTSTDTIDYLGSFIDWGINKIGNDAPNTWRTLTAIEWYYLLNARPNASSLVGVAQVNGVNGLIILPDNWECPSAITFISGFNRSSTEYSAYQTFTAEQWSKMEGAGAVFLPAAGARQDVRNFYVQQNGYYWTETLPYINGTDYISSAGSCCVGFNSRISGIYHYGRYVCMSVRLVKDL